MRWGLWVECVSCWSAIGRSFDSLGESIVKEDVGIRDESPELFVGGGLACSDGEDEVDWLKANMD